MTDEDALDMDVTTPPKTRGKKRNDKDPTGETPMGKVLLIEELNLENLNYDGTPKQIFDLVKHLAQVNQALVKAIYEMGGDIRTIMSKIDKIETKAPEKGSTWASVVGKKSSIEELQQVRSIQKANKEEEERKKREKNLIISSAEPIETTKEICKEMFPEKQLPELEEIGSYTTTINQETKEIKKYKIKFESTQDRELLLRKSYEFRRNKRLLSIFVNPDWTSLEQLFFYNLRMEKKKLNEELSEAQRNENPYVIYADRLIRRSDIPRRSKQN